MQLLVSAASAAFITAVSMFATASAPAVRPSPKPSSFASTNSATLSSGQTGPAEAKITRVTPRGPFRLAVVSSACGASSLRSARGPVVARAPRRRPVGGSGSTGAQRGRWHRELFRSRGGSRRPHRSTFRRTTHDLRAGGRTVGIRHSRSSRHPDRRPLRGAWPLHATRLPPLGGHLRTGLPRSPVAVGFWPADSPAAWLSDQARGCACW